MPKATFACFLFLFIPISVRAQGIDGIVTARGAPLTHVSVHVKSSSTDRETTTDKHGKFKFLLPPGRYEVRADCARFKLEPAEGRDVRVVTITGNETRPAYLMCIAVPTDESVDVHEPPHDSKRDFCPSGIELSRCVSVGELVLQIPPPFQSLWGYRGPDAAEQAKIGPRLPCESVTLEHQQGFSDFQPGANYSVTFYRDGRAELLSAESVEEFNGPRRRFSGSVALTTYGKLCYFLQERRFDQLAPWYGEISTDLPEVRVGLVRDNNTTTVIDYGLVGPIDLWVIEKLMASIKASIEWKPMP